MKTEKMVTIFSRIPESNFRQYFTGIAAQITAVIFPVKHRYRRFFSG